MYENLTTVKRGYWLYAGNLRVPFRIVVSPTTYGTGDYQDAPDVREDQDVPCFYILYQTYDGQEVGGGGHASLQAAKEHAKKLQGDSILWDE